MRAKPTTGLRPRLGQVYANEPRGTMRDLDDGSRKCPHEVSSGTTSRHRPMQRVCLIGAICGLTMSARSSLEVRDQKQIDAYGPRARPISGGKLDIEIASLLNFDVFDVTGGIHFGPDAQTLWGRSPGL